MKEFTNVAQAIRTLEDLTASAEVRCRAVHYLANLDECYEVRNLVVALQNDDFGVRWEASNLLIELGEDAFPEILNALMDPKRVKDPKLRESVVHILHSIEQKDVKGKFTPLLEALQGPAADIVTMQTAYKLSNELTIKSCQEEKEDETRKESPQTA